MGSSICLGNKGVDPYALIQYNVCCFLRMRLRVSKRIPFYMYLHKCETLCYCIAIYA